MLWRIIAKFMCGHRAELCARANITRLGMFVLRANLGGCCDLISFRFFFCFFSHPDSPPLAPASRLPSPFPLPLPFPQARVAGASSPAHSLRVTVSNHAIPHEPRRYIRRSKRHKTRGHGAFLRVYGRSNPTAAVHRFSIVLRAGDK